MGEFMPHLCKITLAAPRSDTDDGDQVLEAMATAIEAGWESPLAVSEDEDLDPPLAEDKPDGGNILDYRILGYPEGAIILVLLEGTDLAQAALAAAALSQHLTTWSPTLLKFTTENVSVSPAAEPIDDDWAQSFDIPTPTRRWSPAELLDEELLTLSAKYLLARAVRSLWDPAKTRTPHIDAGDVIAGGNEHPWGRELTGALGTLLVLAADHEAETGETAKLTVRGSGDPALAEDLLTRARAATELDPEDDCADDDEMRGHVLLSDFMEDHSLTWKQVPKDESPAQTEQRTARQLHELLWAGVRALATLAYSLSDTAGPWQLLYELEDDRLISTLAAWEAEEIAATTEHDSDEAQSAALAHAAMWLAIRRPETLDTAEGERLIECIATNPGALHHVVYNTLLMAGPEPTRKAVDDQPLPADMRSGLTAFVQAQLLTDADKIDYEHGDPYDEMHGALEDALVHDEQFNDRLRAALDVAGLAARLTQTDVNPYRGVGRHISSPRQMTMELLARAALHATVVLTDHDGDATVRLGALATVAHVSAATAGEMAADLPDLTGDDPRTEPAARERARQWINDARQLTGQQATSNGDVGAGDDTQAILDDQTTTDDWPVHRFVSAAAEATAATLRSAGRLDAAKEIFTRE
ncbi:hypothetical protein [Actinoallomurus acaciae]|uniref:Uncharacterized protein n=1 Tax=Actinoallomurus acaciae TaxID=502577 RepID=A0ABV5Y8D4_9ACTN